jgi:hypothetical protein
MQKCPTLPRDGSLAHDELMIIYILLVEYTQKKI